MLSTRAFSEYRDLHDDVSMACNDCTCASAGSYPYSTSVLSCPFPTHDGFDERSLSNRRLKNATCRTVVAFELCARRP